MSNVSYSVVFGDHCAIDDHNPNQRGLGAVAEKGWDEDFLRQTASKLREQGVDAEIVELTPHCEVAGAADACVLVVRNFNQQLCDTLYGNIDTFKFDDFKKMYGKVCDSHSRHLLYIGNTASAPNREESKHTVLPWEDEPELRGIRDWMRSSIGQCDEISVGCVLKYPNIERCGISWHGDGDRKKTALFRLGPNSERHPLHFAWFHRHDIVSPVISVELKHGDFIMYSAKATGADFKKSSIPTVRHATGFLKQGAHPKMTRGKKRERIQSASL